MTQDSEVCGLMQGISLCVACGQIVNRLLLYKDFMQIGGFVKSNAYFKFICSGLWCGAALIRAD
ncbi:MAG: hypothetical protein ACJA2Q_000750 [Pseudohongiellaceae bacterium]|jgi:hypothetical protein